MQNQRSSVDIHIPTSISTMSTSQKKALDIWTEVINLSQQRVLLSRLLARHQFYREKYMGEPLPFDWDMVAFFRFKTNVCYYYWAGAVTEWFLHWFIPIWLLTAAAVAVARDDQLTPEHVTKIRYYMNDSTWIPYRRLDRIWSPYTKIRAQNHRIHNILAPIYCNKLGHLETTCSKK